MTFQMPGGLSPAGEKALWQRGILTWTDFRLHGLKFFSPPRTRRLLRAIAAAESLVASGRWTKYLKWTHPVWLLRLYPIVAPDAVFLDIETTGLQPHHPPITAATLHDQNLQLFVHKLNLHTLPSFLKRARLVVTYHGRKFDLPRLRRHLKLPITFHHIDLAPIARALGLGPGLKAALRQLGWTWPPQLPQAGAEIPTLWNQFCAGSPQALQTILLYNAYDTAVLKWLWVAMYNSSLRYWPLFRPIPLPRLPNLEDLVQKWCQSWLSP